MATIDILNEKINALETSVSAVEAKIEELKGLNNDPAIEAAAEKVDGLTKRLNEAVA